MIEPPEISNRFDAEDIRKLREYNSLKHSKMSHKEILEDIRQGAESFMSEFSSCVAEKFIADKIQNRRQSGDKFEKRR
ncbi:hypothetical protein [Fibrobacter sp. UWB10]|uniref:hypothetical protein n=1 Tax=Fibrobacter sp. UWB10 TaxID=1896201 RepID=UPI002403956B|nr:hypothetical protein [Fibrobacter sp. UWB10]SMP42373.1 hypothetical protein SAMN05720465_0744 [Fibrobacter sp. UWB10]